MHEARPTPVTFRSGAAIAGGIVFAAGVAIAAVVRLNT